MASIPRIRLLFLFVISASSSAVFPQLAGISVWTHRLTDNVQPDHPGKQSSSQVFENYLTRRSLKALHCRFAPIAQAERDGKSL
jgi:hypothetical protein